MRFSPLILAGTVTLASGHLHGRQHLEPDRLGSRIPEGHQRRGGNGENEPLLKRALDPEAPPSGADTSGVPRTRWGSVPYGPTKIYGCVNPGDVAITFDDGPYFYTNDLMDTLKAADIKATFFVTGDNYGRGAINDPTFEWPSMITRMIADGHQVASHTWSHPQLSALDAETRRLEMLYTEIALNDILGFFPTYMRPPYADCDAACTATMEELGYHIVLWNLDTVGYTNNDEVAIENSIKIWDDNVGPSNATSHSWIQLEHDPIYWSVYKLIPHVIASVKEKGFRAVTVGECLGDPQENWYRRLTDVAPAEGDNGYGDVGSTPQPAYMSLPESADGSCGNGFRCPDAQCCSQFGWCGFTTDHCGPGCQGAFGRCEGNDSQTDTGNADIVVPVPVEPVASAPVVEAPADGGYGGGAADPAATVVAPAEPASTYGSSPDGTCGAGSYKCPGTSCCSSHGWCVDCYVSNKVSGLFNLFGSHSGSRSHSGSYGSTQDSTYDTGSSYGSGSHRAGSYGGSADTGSRYGSHDTGSRYGSHDTGSRYGGRVGGSRYGSGSRWGW